MTYNPDDYFEPTPEQMAEFQRLMSPDVVALVDAGRLREQTPTEKQLAKIRPELAKLSGDDPLYLTPTPTDRARVRNCWQNVKEYIRANGGEELTGWMVLLHVYEYYIKLVPHVVVATGNGYVDPTPAVQGTRLLLLPDAVDIDTVGKVVVLSQKKKAQPIIRAVRRVAKAEEILRWKED